MKLVRALDKVDDVDELSATHESYEDHEAEEHVNIGAEQHNRVDHVERKEKTLSDRNKPDPLDLDEREGTA